MARKLFISSTLALAAAFALLLGACKANDTAGGSAASPGAGKNGAAGQAAPAAGTTTVSADGARRVTAPELQKMIEDGTAVIYDTRAKGSYEQEHIKGSLLMPFNEVGARAGELPRGKTLVFYCT